MIICARCKKEMQCIKNGVIATWHETHRYAGDLYECPMCKTQALNTNMSSYYSDKPITKGYQIRMKD